MRAWLRRFYEVVGVPLEVPDPLPEPLERGARALVGMRPPDEARLPLEELAAARFAILAVSGGHLGCLEIICDAIAAETGAERAVICGMGHLIPDTGARFNQRLESFMADAVRRER